MGMLSRMSTIFKSKMNRVLDKAEDPRETLDYSYEKMRDQLRKVKQGVVEVVTSKRRLELQAEKVKLNINKLEDQAKQALQANKEDLARMALQRKQAALYELQGLDVQIVDMEREQEKLSMAESRLQSKVEAFRTKKEVIKAQYSAAEASVRIGSALSGVSEEMADVGMSIERAEDKTERMRARAGAIDELASSGVLEDFTGREDDIGRQLAELSASQNVESELESLRRQLPSGEKKSLTGGAS